jgi:hypothetical protein
MMTLKISDKENGFLTLDLADILRVLGEPVVSSFYWRIADLECHPPRLAESLALHHQTATGMPIDVRGEELLDFAGEVTQTEMGIFLASAAPWPSPSGARATDVAQWRSSAELVVEVFDASYWTVSTSQSGALENLRQTFKQTELLTGTTA